MTGRSSAVRLAGVLTAASGLLAGCAMLGVGGSSSGPVTGPTGLGAVVGSARLQGAVPPTPLATGGPRVTDPGLTLRAIPVATSSTKAPTPSPVCTGAFGPAPQVTPTVVGSAPGSLSVSFSHPGDPNVSSYRVAAVEQVAVIPTLPPLVWKPTPAPATCKIVTVALTGLISGATYVVWLDAIVTDWATSVPHDVMLGRSTPVLVP